ncbi:MAG TPA: hypothetical protein ACFCUY_10535 [Xenococcaceae cyanobacterium]
MIDKISASTLHHSLKTLFCSLGIISLTPTTAYSIPAKIWTAWQPTTLNSQQCINRAEVAVRDSGYSQNLEIFGEGATSGVYGENGEYSVTVRCGINNGLVFFVVAGPASAIASEELYALIENF